VDMLYGDQAKVAGIVNFRRPEGLNDYPAFLDALADIVEPRLEAARGAAESGLLRDEQRVEFSAR